jgi:hypothetical protein
MPRLIKAPIEVAFDFFHANQKVYEREYHQLTEADNDPVGQWIKLAKAKGETSDTDDIVLKLLVELHRKVDDLTRLVKEEESHRIKLPFHAQIDSIGFEHIKFIKPILEVDAVYYGRITMPIFPQREVAVLFKAQDKNLAKIVKIHSTDEKEWAAYVTARERVMIREQKANDDDR